MQQQTEDWYKARLGKVTASRVSDVLAKTKSGYSATRKNYMMQLLCERLTSTKEESFVNAAMQRGTELEPIARGAYEAYQDVMVTETGFVVHSAMPDFGASPDGLVSDHGLVEIKCPNTAQHVDFLRTGKIDNKYQWQMLAQMCCTDRQYCDFVSFDDRLPTELQYKCVRFDRDEQRINEMLDEISVFLDELSAIENDLQKVRNNG